MLELYHGRTPSDTKEIRKSSLELEDDRYEIKAIINYNNKIKLYECKWIGYPNDKNTQELLSKLDRYKDILKEF